MPIVPTEWTSMLTGLLTSKSFIGVQMPTMANAVGSGIALGILGTPFSTVDVGSVPSVGVGTGVGITGISPSSMSGLLVASAISTWGQATPKFFELADAIANTVVTQMASVNLSSTHALVFAGAGNIIQGGVSVDASKITISILLLAPFIGQEWFNTCDMIGKAVASSIISSGVGTVVITGPPPPPPIVPVLGVGVGSGIIY